MKIKELKQVKTTVRFKNVESAIKEFNMIVKSKLALKGQMNFGTLVYTLGDKIIRVHEFAAQVNEMLIIREMSNTEIHSHYQWEEQFREAAYNAGYQYANGHEDDVV